MDLNPFVNDQENPTYDNETNTSIMVLPVVEYFKWRKNRHSWKELLTPTDTLYPRILALGVLYTSEHFTIIARCGNWKLRLAHELGHAKGLVHIMTPGYVMHPWGFLRGTKYIKDDGKLTIRSKCQTLYQNFLKLLRQM